MEKKEVEEILGFEPTIPAHTLAAIFIKNAVGYTIWDIKFAAEHFLLEELNHNIFQINKKDDINK